MILMWVAIVIAVWSLADGVVATASRNRLGDAAIYFRVSFLASVVAIALGLASQ